MESYKFVYEGKEYQIGEDNCCYLGNDEERPVVGLELAQILDILNQAEEVNFDRAYYDQPCENCLAGKADKAKVFPFLEEHFYVFTRKGRYVTASIAKDYEELSSKRLMQKDEIDNSYIVSIEVCENCGTYSVEIEQCEV